MTAELSADGDQHYDTVVTIGPKKRVMVPVPFDPDEVWGAKPEHHVSGTVNGRGVRAVIGTLDDGFGIMLGPAWRRDCGVGPGDSVSIALHPEGPQRGELAPDLREALPANPGDGAFFDSLAQFYRGSYLRWIDATKRRPELRSQRIAEVVRLLAAGHKERPGP